MGITRLASVHCTLSNFDAAAVVMRNSGERRAGARDGSQQGRPPDGETARDPDVEGPGCRSARVLPSDTGPSLVDVFRTLGLQLRPPGKKKNKNPQPSINAHRVAFIRTNSI